MAKHADPDALDRRSGTVAIGDEQQPSDADGHADPADDDETSTTAGQFDADTDADVLEHRLRAWLRLPRVSGTAAIGVTTIIALCALCGWLGIRVHQDDVARAQQNMFVQAARQGVINLTTMDHKTIDADIKRILDSTTGNFHDDFETRSVPFADVVRKAQSSSSGTITNAALASEEGDRAQVLVTVSLKMSNIGDPEQPAHSWRMRIEVQKTGDTAKVSNVQFVT